MAAGAGASVDEIQTAPTSLQYTRFTPALEQWRFDLETRGRATLDLGDAVVEVQADPFPIYAEGATVSDDRPNPKGNGSQMIEVSPPNVAAFRGEIVDRPGSRVLLFFGEAEYLGGYLQTADGRISFQTNGTETNRTYVYYTEPSLAKVAEELKPLLPSHPEGSEIVPTGPEVAIFSDGDFPPWRPLLHLAGWSFYDWQGQSATAVRNDITDIHVQVSDVYVDEVGFGLTIGDIDITDWNPNWQQHDLYEDILWAFSKSGRDGTQESGWCLTDKDSPKGTDPGDTDQGKNQHHIATCHLWLHQEENDLTSGVYGLANDDSCSSSGSLTSHEMYETHKLAELRNDLTALERTVIVAHEIGHSFGATHEDAGFTDDGDHTIMYEDNPWHDEAAEFTFENADHIFFCQTTDSQLEVNYWIEHLFEDDRDSETESGWTATGLWHETSRRGGDEWWYGQESTGDYDTGSSNTGILQSRLIDVPDGLNPVQLLFTSWYETETGTTDDKKRVFYRTCDTCSWTRIALLSGGQQQTERHHYVLDGVAGKQLQFMFTFKALDGDQNNFEGWYVDNVAVLATDPRRVS